MRSKWLTMLIVASCIMPLGAIFWTRQITARIEAEIEFSQAITDSNYDRVRELIESGADPNKLPLGVLSPLDMAVPIGDVEMVDLLIELGADCSATNWVDYTPTMLAVLHSDEVLEYLGAQDCESGITEPIASELLYTFAKYNNSAQRVDYLLDHGAVIDGIVPGTGAIPLHRAVHRGNWELVEYYLTLGADINARDVEGRTPVDMLLQYEEKLPQYDRAYIDRIHWLREQGAKSGAFSELELDRILVEFLSDSPAPIDAPPSQ